MLTSPDAGQVKTASDLLRFERQNLVCVKRLEQSFLMVALILYDVIDALRTMN